MLQPRIFLSSTAKCHQTLSIPRLQQITRSYATQSTFIPSNRLIPIPPSIASETSSATQSPFDSDLTPTATVKINLPSIKPVEATSLMITYTPRTPGLRHLKRVNNPHLWKGGPWRSLTYPKVGHGKGGRNSSGRVTVRHRGGGHRRRIRTIDFRRLDEGEQHVLRIEYDPNRSAHIALLQNKETEKMSYIIAPVGLRAGDTVTSFRKGIPKSLMDEMGGRIDPGLLAAKTCYRGNCLPIRLVPPGTQVYCVGSAPERGAVFCRSAGTFATVIGKFEEKKDANGKSNAERDEGEFRFMVVRLQSGEVRRVHKDACATIGVVSNPMHQYEQLGKAGRSRWLNIRPTVRGMAMNACDHPHGGGRGKSKGNRIPVSPWGTPAKSGYKTRSKRHPNKWVVQPRPRNHGKRRAKK